MAQPTDSLRFCGDKVLRCLRLFLLARGIQDVHRVTPTHLRQYLLHLCGARNPGGLHAAYRAMRTFSAGAG